MSSMEKLGFKFKEIIFEWPSFDRDSLYLWIWHADKIPPHIGISLKDCYWSLTYKVNEIELPVDVLSQKAKRTNIPLVLVQLNQKITKEEISSVYELYELALPLGPTCLTPIKNCLNETNEIKQLKDLLNSLAVKNELNQVYGVNLPVNYRGIPHYTMEDITDRIAVLRKEKENPVNN